MVRLGSSDRKNRGMVQIREKLACAELPMAYNGLLLLSANTGPITVCGSLVRGVPRRTETSAATLAVPAGGVALTPNGLIPPGQACCDGPVEAPPVPPTPV